MTTININSVQLTGRVGEDPDIKYFESGSCCATFSFACDGWAAGQKKTNWFRLKALGKTAEKIYELVKKGRSLAVQGKLEYNCWTARDTGEIVRVPEILIDRWEFVGGRDE